MLATHQHMLTLGRIITGLHSTPLCCAPQGSYRHHAELWIVMEHCSGGSVNDVLSATGTPLPEALIAHICSEALKVPPTTTTSPAQAFLQLTPATSQW